jgi:hypothetical protein
MIHSATVDSLTPTHSVATYLCQKYCLAVAVALCLRIQQQSSRGRPGQNATWHHDIAFNALCLCHALILW